MDVGAPIVAGGEASELGDTRAKVRSTTHRCRPSLADVSTPRRAMRGMMERARQSRRHRRWSQALSTARQGIAKRCPERGMQRLGSLAGSPSTPRSHSRHGVERRCERHAVVTVHTGQRQAERRAAAVGDAMPFRARTATVRRVRPRLVAPLLAPMDAASSEARDQSSAPARSSRSSRTRCSRSHTPARCQSRSRCQQVMPEQPNTSRGSVSNGRPERKTNTIPRRASRSATRGRPPFGFGGSSGRNGATAAHISSVTSLCLMEGESTRRRSVSLGALRTVVAAARRLCPWPI